MKSIVVYADGRTEERDIAPCIWFNLMEHESGRLVRTRHFRCADVARFDGGEGVLVWVERPEADWKKHCADCERRTREEAV